MKRHLLKNLALSLLSIIGATSTLADPAPGDSIFSTEEILDESTLDAKTLEDWHVDTVTGTTRQKLVEIKVAEWWSGQDFRIPVRMIVPLKGKAKGFRITGANSAESLSKDIKPIAFDARLLTNGVGIVKTVVKPLAQIPGKRGLEQRMGKRFLNDLNPRYTTVWIWSMTLMRATTAAYAETDHFEKGKVAGAGGSKNGISPATALINDERFTATCSKVAFAWASPTRKLDRDALEKVTTANEAFFEAAKAGEFELNPQRAAWYQANMVGSPRSLLALAVKAGKSPDEMAALAGDIIGSLCVTEHWDRLEERGVDMLFEPGTHDYVAYDILWGAQNHPQLPVYYPANGGHKMQKHPKAETNSQNLEAFLWNHFFGGEPLLSPPTSNHEIDGNQLKVSVRFENGPRAETGRLWWIYDRAPAILPPGPRSGSSPALRLFHHMRGRRQRPRFGRGH